MKGFGWLAAAPKVFKTVVAVVHAVETLKGDAPGAEKKQAALSMVGALWPLAELGLHADVDDERVKTAVGRIIDDVVLVENLVADIQAQRAATDAVGIEQPAGK